MQKDLSYVLTETMVRKAVKDFGDSPKRSLRNIVDMAVNFSNGRFQKHFFETTQTMLKNQESSYYDLFENIFNNIDTERIITLGMNIGYNSCTRGAATIRGIESEKKFNIPWAAHMEVSEKRLNKNKDTYLSLFEQGQKLGIYTWIIFTDANPEDIYVFAKSYPDIAFIFVVYPEKITDSRLELAKGINNVMYAVIYSHGAEQACQILKNKTMPYSVLIPYNSNNIDQVINEIETKKIEALQPIITALLPDHDCDECTQEKMYNFIKNGRKAQTSKTILWETMKDSNFVDSIISDDSCFLWIDSNGDLYNFDGQCISEKLNVFESTFENVLRQAFPK